MLRIGYTCWHLVPKRGTPTMVDNTYLTGKGLDLYCQETNPLVSPSLHPESGKAGPSVPAVVPVSKKKEKKKGCRQSVTSEPRPQSRCRMHARCRKE